MFAVPGQKVMLHIAVPLLGGSPGALVASLMLPVTEPTSPNLSPAAKKKFVSAVTYHK